VRSFTLVVPLQAERFLAENGGLEASPRLNLEVVERAAMRAKTMGDTRRKVDERAGFDFFEVVFHFNHTPAFKSHVAMRGAFGVRVGTAVHMIRRGAAFLVVHLSCLDRVRRREPASITKPDAGLGAESANAAATGITQRAELFSVEEISGPSRQAGFDGRRRRRRYHVQQFEGRARRFKSSGLQWSDH